MGTYILDKEKCWNIFEVLYHPIPHIIIEKKVHLPYERWN